MANKNCTYKIENNNTLAKTKLNDFHKDVHEAHRHTDIKSLTFEMYESANTYTYSNKQKTQPKTCQELWKCGVLCSSINPLERIKCHEGEFCLMSPIPTTDDSKFKQLSEPLFSRRTSFAIYKEVFEVDQRCTCVKFNGIEDECKHPECKQNLKCLSLPLATCSPAENWNKYYRQTL